MSSERNVTGDRQRRDAEAADATFAITYDDLVHHVGAPLFVLDVNHDVLVWNDGMRELTGSDEATAKAAEHAAEAWYHDDRRAKLLADKVLDAPENTDREFDVERVTGSPFTEYRDHSVFTDADGERRHCTFRAAPLYDGGELIGVVEIVKDRTEDVRRAQRVEALVEEVTETMDAIQRGELGARADFEVDEHVDEDLHSVVGSLNEMAKTLDEIVTDVDARTDELREVTAEIAERAAGIDESAREQVERSDAVAEEVSDLSAAVEEVAATTDGVAATARDAREHARGGSDRAKETGDVMTAMRSSTRDVRGDVDHLAETVTEIDAVVETINDIADQTNLLALNANIEAARTSDGGGGFAVVADEVKSLAEETQAEAAEIEKMIADVQRRTDETVESLDGAEREVDEGVAAVEESLEKLQEIVDAVDEAVSGIEDVSTVTDDQAASAEEIASMVERAREHAEGVASEVAAITEATERQTQTVAEIERCVGRLRRGSGER